MKILLHIITVIFLSEISAQDFKANPLKDETGIYLILQGKDTTEYNKKGNLIREVFYNAGGVKDNETKYLYNSANYITFFEKHEYYGSDIKIEYFYNQNDSIIKRIDSENDYSYTSVFKRNKKNQLICREESYNDTIRTKYTYEYNSDNLPIKICRYDYFGNLMYTIVKKYKDGFLLEEIKLVDKKYYNWEDSYCQFKYDSLNNLTEIRDYYGSRNENGSKYSLVLLNYDKQKNLTNKEIRNIGNRHEKKQVYKWDTSQNLIYHLRTGFRGEEDIYNYKFDYDNKGNWIEKIELLNNHEIRKINREITYY